MKKEEIISLLGDGNPGGETVLRSLFANGKIGNGMVLWMKETQMKGARLWCLYKYVCDMDITMTYIILKTLQYSANPRDMKLWNSREHSVIGVIDFFEYMGV